MILLIISMGSFAFCLSFSFLPLFFSLFTIFSLWEVDFFIWINFLTTCDPLFGLHDVDFFCIFWLSIAFGFRWFSALWNAWLHVVDDNIAPHPCLSLLVSLQRHTHADRYMRNYSLTLSLPSVLHRSFSIPQLGIDFDPFLPDPVLRLRILILGTLIEIWIRRL